MGELIKGLIGKEDLQIQNNVNDPETFERIASVGGALTLTKIPDIWGGTGKINVAKVEGNLTGSVNGCTGLLIDDQHVLDAEVLTVAAALAHKTRHQDTGADEISVTGLSGLLADDQHVLDAEVLAVAAAKTHGSLHLPNAADPIGLPKFSAHKNGTDQTAIVTATYTKVTFTTEVYDVGSTYDAANSKWVPGIIGKVHIDACLYYTDSIDGTALRVVAYLNGVIYKVGQVIGGTGNVAVVARISCDIPITAITDYIEIYAYQVTGFNKNIFGDSIYTYFMGHMLP